MPHFFPQNARVRAHVKTILIVYHSLTGAARQMAEALARDTADGGPAILLGAPWLEQAHAASG